MQNRRIWAGLIGTVVGLSLACGGGEMGSAEDPVLAQPAVIDAELMTDLEGLVSTCEVNVSGCTIKCPNKEKQAIVDRYYGYKPTKNKADAIDTLAAAMANSDPKLQTATVSVLRSAFKSYKDVESVPPAAAMRFIEAWSPLPKYQANQSAAAVVHAAMLSKHPAVAERLYQAIDEARENSTKSEAAKHLLTYGRLRAFDKVQELGKDPSEKVVTGALKSWLNLRSPTDAEKEAICPWIDGFLQDPRGNVFGAAGDGASRCGGTWLDKLLDEGERRLNEDHVFERPHQFVFRELCHNITGEATEGREVQCARNYAYLQKVVDDPKVSADGRAMALYAIYYQRRDAKTKALAKTYLKHKEPKIAKEAKEIVDKLKDK